MSQLGRRPGNINQETDNMYIFFQILKRIITEILTWQDNAVKECSNLANPRPLVLLLMEELKAFKKILLTKDLLPQKNLAFAQPDLT